jgi:hypothetical protein
MRRVERRAFLVGTLALLAAPLVAEAQPAADVPRTGYLSPFSPTSESMKPIIGSGAKCGDPRKTTRKGTRTPTRWRLPG